MHEFKCSEWGCKVKIWHYLDTKDSHSTSNMHKHIQSCWGNEALNAAADAKDVSEVHMKMVRSILRSGSITAAFQCKSEGKITYSNCQPTGIEIQCVITPYMKCHD